MAGQMAFKPLGRRIAEIGMGEIVGMLRVVSVIESAGAFVDAELCGLLFC